MGLQRCGGITVAAGALPWLDTGSFVRTGPDSKDRSYLLLTCRRGARTHGAMPRDGQSQLRACGSGLEGRTTWVTLWWVSATDLPDQDEVVDEAFCRQLEESSCLQALVLVRDFSHSDICWKDNTAKQKQSRRFLECIDEKDPRELVDFQGSPLQA